MTTLWRRTLWSLLACLLVPVALLLALLRIVLGAVVDGIDACSLRALDVIDRADPWHSPPRGIDNG